MGIDAFSLSTHQRAMIDPKDQKHLHKELRVEYNESVEQSKFAGWLKDEQLLPPAIWHRTDKRSTATVGCPDFIVPICGQTLYIEFKKPGAELAPPQELFKRRLQEQGHVMWITLFAEDAVKLVHQFQITCGGPEK